MKRFGFLTEEKEIVKTAQELSYFRTYRLDVYTEAGFNVKNLLAFVARKLGLSQSQLVFLTYREIEKYLKESRTFPSRIADQKIQKN